ncbi:type II secretion system protein GspM [Stutzerimonas kirkiae]|uniref:type II secretion system protein GspM n=1 Tax=Stutzerimonas kirkiae TaxID=2211392 RepID=UPI0010384AF7|nr:type II secretion system protein GspM [Stutzerimonas kirkiae]TBV10603.1 MSHA biogenesis protein MshJ [Stutzerimonas kirkiae]
MNDLLKRWHALAPREQWLCYAVGLALLVMLYYLLLAEPLALREQTYVRERQDAETRLQEAQATRLDLEARMAADPNLPYRDALRVAEGVRQEVLRRIDEETGSLIPPAQMKSVLQELLRNQPRLKLINLESSSTPLELPGDTPPQVGSTPSEVPLVLYRHGLKLTLEGGYFDLLEYLRAVQASGWRLHWDSLDHRVSEEGHEKARIIIDLHTLSRDQGVLGV